MFVIFVIIFGDLSKCGKPCPEVEQESNPGLTRRNKTPSDSPSATPFAKGQPIPLYTIGSDPRLQRFVQEPDLG